MAIIAVVLTTMMLVAAQSTAVATDWQCTPEQAQRNLQLLQQHASQHHRWSACPSHQWLVRYAQLSNTSPEVILDVGCNKGYESINFFALFAPAAGATPPVAYQVHLNASYGNIVGQTRRAKHLCGVCNDCQHTLGEGHVLPQQPRGVHVYCFEPSLTHFEALLTLRKTLANGLAEQRAEWHLVNAAVGSGVRLVRFPRACDTELCAVAASQQDGTTTGHEAAIMVDVASFADAEGLQNISILKIDTEVRCVRSREGLHHQHRLQQGQDPAAIAGAKPLLQAGSVKVLLFEYHGTGLWARVELRDVVTMLDELDYGCFFDGQPTLTSISGSCWRSEYEFKGWSNVVCAHRQHFMFGELLAMSWQHSPDKGAPQ